MYEVLFVRIFGLIFGNTTLAVSTVLASYMMGMAVGGLLFGKMADRIRRPMLLYAILELGAGISALAVFFARACVEPLIPVLPGTPFVHQLLQFVIAGIMLLPMAAMMGGTLPAVARVSIRDRREAGLKGGSLYAVNTAGAVAGVLLAGFVFIGGLGVTRTLLLAFSFNLCVACAAFVLSLRMIRPADSEVSVTGTDQGVREDLSGAAHPGRGDSALGSSHAQEAFPVAVAPGAILAVMCLSGLCGLAYEVLWTRVLVFVTTNSVYAFSVMLMTFLSGLAIGSSLASRFSDRVRRPDALLGMILMAAGGGAVLAAVSLSWVPALHDSFFRVGPATTWWEWNGIRFLECFLVMAPPTILLGMSFPLASRLMITRVDATGSRFGLLTFFNTAGGACGSFLAGTVLVPWLGTAVALALFLSIHISAGLLLIVLPSPSRPRRLLFVFPLTLLFLSFIWSGRLRQWAFMPAFVHVEKDFRLVEAREGIEGTVTVHRSERLVEPVTRLDVDGLNVAGTSFLLTTLQILQAHIPLSLCPDARHVLQIGFGTGQTTHSASLHPIETMELVEISRDVMNLSRIHFADLNRTVWTDSRIRIRIADGKNALKYAGKRFDVIMNDANYAVATASASLFTRDHFENGKKALRPGGFFSTWMTIDLDPHDFAVVLATFQSVFPYCALWMAPNTVNKQVILVGSAEPWSIDFGAFCRKLETPEIKAELALVNIGSVYDFLDCLVLDSDGIREISGSSGIASDDRPVLEFSRRDIRSRDFCSFQNLAGILVRRPDIRKHLTGLPVDPEENRTVEERLRRHRIAVRKILEGMLLAYQGRATESLETVLDASRIIPESRIGAEFFAAVDRQIRQMAAESVSRAGDSRSRSDMVRYAIQSARPDAGAILAKAVKDFPGDPDILLEKARWHLAHSETDSAEAVLQRSLTAHTRHAASWFLLGEIRKLRGESGQALEDYQRAVREDRRHYQALNSAGRLLQGENRNEEALQYFRRSLAMIAYQPEIASGIGDCHMAAGRIDSALGWYEKAAEWAPDRPALLAKWATALAFAREDNQAAAVFETVLDRDSLDAEIWYNYGCVVVRLGRLGRAAHAFLKAKEIDPGNPDAFNNLGMTYRLMGRIQDARRVFSEGVRLHPGNPLLLENLQKMDSAPRSRDGSNRSGGRPE